MFAPSDAAVSDLIEFTSVSTTPTTRSRPRQWDLDGDGQYDDASGSTALASLYRDRGPHTVRLRVTRLARPHGHDRHDLHVTAAARAMPPKKIRPWPKIRIVGFAGAKRVRVDLLTVKDASAAPA